MTYTHNTLDLKELMDECENLESCKALLEALKIQKPLQANYNYAIIEGSPSIKKDVCTRKIYRVFRDYNTSSFFNCTRGKAHLFYRTDPTFEQHIGIEGLTDECKLIVSEQQNLIIKTLEQVRNKNEEKLIKNCLQSVPELKLASP